MRRRDALRAGVALGASTLAGCALGYDGPAFREGFEGELRGWETGAHVGPEVPLSEFDWTVEPSSERAAEGERSLRVFTEGDHDDGTAWAVHPVPVEPGSAYDARVSASFWSETESFNTLRHAVMRLGRERPREESDFPPPGGNATDAEDATSGGSRERARAPGDAPAPAGGLREPLHLQAGWREYAFEWTTPRLGTDRLFVAVGVSVVWESDATHFVDDLRVDLSER